MGALGSLEEPTGRYPRINPADMEQEEFREYVVEEMMKKVNSEDDAVDMVNHPPHYTSHPSNVECITITEHMGFCLGNALKYIWRADLKGGVEDLRKAIWYIEREIQRLERSGNERKK